MDIAYTQQNPTLNEILLKIAPARFKFDPLGLVSGYRAFLIWMHFNAMDDNELAALGLKRSDIARLASRSILDN